jgi:hypothetical protein
MGLLNAAIGVNSSSGSTTATIQRGYDLRGRTINGIYAQGGGAIADSNGSGSITISGSEAQVTKTTSNASINLGDPTFGAEFGSYPYEYYYCPNNNCTSGQGQLYCQTDYYAGTVTITVQSSPPFSASAGWGQGNESHTAIDAALVAGLNGTGSPVTATLNGGVILTSVTSGAAGNYPVTISLTQLPPQQGPAAPCN